MKHSHLQTPRSLSECSFTTGYTTGPAGSAQRGWGYPVVVAACIVVALVWAAAPIKG